MEHSPVDENVVVGGTLALEEPIGEGQSLVPVTGGHRWGSGEKEQNWEQHSVEK